MNIYIYTPADGSSASLVKAARVPGGWEYRVHHADNGYSVWPSDQFEATHRVLTRREAQLINHSVAELEVMAISDTPGDFNVLDGSLVLADGRRI